MKIYPNDLDTLSDIVITSPIAENGLVYDGTNWVNRPTQYHHYLTADNPLTNGTAQQPWFATANDGISLPAGSVWKIQGVLLLQSGVVSHITSVGFPFVTAGVAPTGKVTFTIFSVAGLNTIVRAQDTITYSTMAGGVINSASILPNFTVLVDGQFCCTDLGTLTPSLTFSVAPAGTNLTLQGSYITLTRMGDTSGVSNGGWS